MDIVYNIYIYKPVLYKSQFRSLNVPLHVFIDDRLDRRHLIDLSCLLRTDRDKLYFHHELLSSREV